MEERLEFIECIAVENKREPQDQNQFTFVRRNQELYLSHFPKSLSDLDSLTLVDIPVPSALAMARPASVEARPRAHGRLKDEHNRAAELEPAHFFAALQRVPTERLARGPVRRFRVARVPFPALGCERSLAVCLGVGRQAVGAQLCVKVDPDRAYVCRSHGRVAEEPVTPAAQEDDALVQSEEAWERALEVWGDGVEFACKVSAAFDDPGCRRVEAVVVSRREVDDDVVECLVGCGLWHVPGCGFLCEIRLDLHFSFVG